MLLVTACDQSGISPSFTVQNNYHQRVLAEVAQEVSQDVAVTASTYDPKDDMLKLHDAEKAKLVQRLKDNLNASIMLSEAVMNETYKNQHKIDKQAVDLQNNIDRLKRINDRLQESDFTGLFVAPVKMFERVGDKGRDVTEDDIINNMQASGFTFGGSGILLMYYEIYASLQKLNTKMDNKLSGVLDALNRNFDLATLHQQEQDLLKTCKSMHNATKNLNDYLDCHFLASDWFFEYLIANFSVNLKQKSVQKDVI